MGLLYASSALSTSTPSTAPGRMERAENFSTAEGGVSHFCESFPQIQSAPLVAALMCPVFSSAMWLHKARVGSPSHSILPYSKHHPRAQLHMASLRAMKLRVSLRRWDWLFGFSESSMLTGSDNQLIPDPAVSRARNRRITMSVRLSSKSLSQPSYTSEHVCPQ